MSGGTAKASVLIVDDDPGVLRAAARILDELHEVRATTSPLEALEFAAAAPPDLAICDVRMPEVDGFELHRRLKALDAEIDVILITGAVSDPDAHLVRSLREGAFYFVPKPFQRDSLIALVDRCLELRSLREYERATRRRMQAELETARALMEAVLPPASASLGGVEVRARVLPSHELSGDVYGYEALPGGGVAFLLADVVGHGAPAAMLTGLVASQFHGAAASGFDPVRFVEGVREALRPFPYDQFVTAVAGVLRPGEVLEYVSAGHPDGRLCAPDAPPATAASTGPMINRVFPAGSWEARRVALGPRGVLVVHTDGLTEQCAGPDGTTPLDEVLPGPAEAGRIVDGLFGAVERVLGGEPAADDISVLALGW